MGGRGGVVVLVVGRGRFCEVFWMRRGGVVIRVCEYCIPSFLVLMGWLVGSGKDTRFIS